MFSIVSIKIIRFPGAVAIDIPDRQARFACFEHGNSDMARKPKNRQYSDKDVYTGDEDYTSDDDRKDGYPLWSSDYSVPQEADRSRLQRRLQARRELERRREERQLSLLIDDIWLVGAPLRRKTVKGPLGHEEK